MNRLRCVLWFAALLATGCASTGSPAHPEGPTTRGRRSKGVIAPSGPVLEPPAHNATAHDTALNAAASPVIHIVRRGETAYRIARNFAVSVDELAAANGLSDPRRIFEGQRLTIPRPFDRDPDRETLTPVTLIQPSPVLTSTTQPRIPALPSAAEPVHSAAASWIWPVEGPLGSRFGAERRRHSHAGVDILAAAGTDVRAARPGRVLFAGSRGHYGRLVIIDHEDGYTSYYSHNSKNRVSEGDRVEQGEIVAECGQSGNATAPHVHFEIRLSGEPLDPLPFLP